MKQLTSLVCLLLGTVLAQDTFAQHEPNALNGLYLYRSYCLICHGNDGKTIGPISRLLKLEPADLTSETYQAMETTDLAAIIACYDTKTPECIDRSGKNAEVGHGALRGRSARYRGVRIPFE